MAKSRNIVFSPTDFHSTGGRGTTTRMVIGDVTINIMNCHVSNYGSVYWPGINRNSMKQLSSRQRRQRAWRLSQRRCFRCNLPGHLARYCTLLPDSARDADEKNGIGRIDGKMNMCITETVRSKSDDGLNKAIVCAPTIEKPINIHDLDTLGVSNDLPNPSSEPSPNKIELVLHDKDIHSVY